MNPRRSVIIKKLLKIAIPIGIVVVVVWGLWFLFIPREQTAPFVKTLARAGQKTAAPLDAVEFNASDLATEHILESLAVGIPDTIDDAQTRAQVLDGIRTTVAFFKARSSTSPDDYFEWAQAEGLHIVSTFPTKPPATSIKWEKLYRFCSGDKTGSPITPELVFRANHQHQSTVHDGALRPVGLVTDPLGVEIDITEFTHFADTFDAFPIIKGDGLDMDFWLGGSSMGGIPLFEPERNLKQILDEYDSTLAMRIKLISVGATGIRIPMIMTLYHDPLNGRWRIQNILIQNVTWDSGLGLNNMTGMFY